MSKFETKIIGIRSIEISETRMRRLNPATIEQLKDSMRKNGLINPITVTLRAESNWQAGHLLIAGLHRLEAAKALKWESITATVVSGLDAAKAKLLEIDENLIRGELTPLERNAHLAARAKAWEEIHGPAKAVGAAAANAKMERGLKDATANFAVASPPKQEAPAISAGQRVERGMHKKDATDKLSVASPPKPRIPAAFTTETAKAIGQSERDVRRNVALGKKAEETPNMSKAIGTSLDKGVEIAALVTLPQAKQQELIDRAAAGEKVSAKTEAKKVARAEKEQTLAAKQCALPDKKYGVIVADPEWKFETWSANGMDRSADNHYPCSETGVIMDRKVGELAAPDCVLFLWATVPMLPQALDVMKAWGFTYKSHFMWLKDRVGTGYWNRNKHELLLIGTRGAIPAPAPGTQWDSVIEAPVGAHSAKPERFMEMIEAYYPNLPKIELNARTARKGWDAWGLEAPANEWDSL